MSNFATVAELALYTGKTIANDDPSAMLALQLASDLIRSECQNNILQETTTIKLDGDLRPSLLLPHPPVTSITSISEDGVELDPELDYSFNAAGVLRRSKNSIVVISSYWLDATGRNVWSGKSLANIEITYVHGYVTAPAAVKLVALSVSDRILATFPTGIKQETLGQYSVTYAMPSVSLLDHEKIALDPYRNVQAY